MSQTDITHPITPVVCIERERRWLVDSERWRLKVTDENPRETVAYCADCAEREFGHA